MQTIFIGVLLRTFAKTFIGKQGVKTPCSVSLAGTRGFNPLPCLFARSTILFLSATALFSHRALGQQESSTPLKAPPPHVFEIPSNADRMELGNAIQYYEDIGKTLAFSDICSPGMATQWQTYSKETLSFGFKRSAYWFRFALSNACPQHNDWLLEIAFPPLDSIELFSPQAGGRYARHVMGDYLPFSEREVKYRTFLKRLDMPDTAARVYYLRVRTSSTTIVPITLHRNEEFIEHSSRRQLFYGWLMGALMILIAYHLILFVFTRENSYIFYLVYMFGVLFYTATVNGFTAQYFLPQSGTALQYCTLLAIGLALIGLVLFTRAFLSTAKESPRFDIVLLGAVGYLIVLVVAALFIDYLTVNIILAFSLLPIVVLCYGVAVSIAWRVRSRQYQYFLIGSIALMLAGVVASFMTMGVFPNNNFTRNSVQYGAIIEAMLFSFALSQRYKILQNEKERAQEENFRLVRSANETLHNAVQERTTELNIKNVDLEAANEEIHRQIDVQAEQAREIELANTTLQEQNERLNVLNREKNEIMGIVAHDLKNPLAAVRGLADLVQSGFAEPEQVPEITKQIVNTSDRMLALVKKLLDVSRLESGGVQFQALEFDIAPMVENAIHQYRQPAEAKHITLHYSRETNSSIVIADEQATLEVLENIISNAVKYSPFHKHVFVRVKSNHSYVRIEVQDQGLGISEADKPKLFGKFARLSARPTGGEHSTGLGLSIVKKMVEAMNGKVWCESEYGNGATFIVELPSGTTPKAKERQQNK